MSDDAAAEPMTAEELAEQEPTETQSEDDLGLEALAAKINGEEPVEEPAPQQTAEESPETDAEHPPEENAQQDQPEAAPEAATEPDAPSDLEKLTARVELAEERAKQFESQLGRATGAEGFLKRRVAELEAENAKLRQGQPAPDGGYTMPDAPATAEAPPAPPTATPSAADDEVRTYVVAQAIQQAGVEFAEANASNPEILIMTKERMQDHESELNSLLSESSPKVAAERVHRLLSLCYKEARVEYLNSAEPKAEAQRVDQAEKLKKQRRAATISTSSDVAAEPEAPLNPEDMPVDKLGAMIDEMNLRT